MLCCSRCRSNESVESDAGDQERKTPWPVYKQEEVAQHVFINDVWVTMGNKVYDMTGFVPDHPGGAEGVMLAAGGPVEPVFERFTHHKAKWVRRIMARHRVGTLDGDSTGANTPQASPKAKKEFAST